MSMVIIAEMKKCFLMIGDENGFFLKKKRMKKINLEVEERNIKYVWNFIKFHENCRINIKLN